jgi:hypothetical protein
MPRYGKAWLIALIVLWGVLIWFSALLVPGVTESIISSCAIAAIIVVAWLIGSALFRQKRAVHRQRSRLCPNCGFDLRASPKRCPECGEVPEISN